MRCLPKLVSLFIADGSRSSASLHHRAIQKVINALRLLILLRSSYRVNDYDVRTSTSALALTRKQGHVALSGVGETPKHSGSSITARHHV